MAADLIQVKAAIPRELKRRAFAAFAMREEKFNRWLQRELEEFVHESAELAEAVQRKEGAHPQTRPRAAKRA